MATSSRRDAYSPTKRMLAPSNRKQVDFDVPPGQMATTTSQHINNEPVLHTITQYPPSDDSDESARAHPNFLTAGEYIHRPHDRRTPPSRDDPNLKEVYLFYCCGSPKELRPAYEYLPMLQMLFYIFNTFVFLFGLADLGMGLWFRIDPKVYEIHKHLETQNFTIGGWIMLFGGFLACIMSFLGCLASMKQEVGLLLFYLLITTSLMLAFVSTVILLSVYGLGSALEQFLIKELYEQIRRRIMSTEVNPLDTSDATQFMDFVQVKMRCCGALDFRDYQKLGMVIPTTCYTLAGNYVNAPGCGRAVRRLLDIRAGMGVGFTVGSVFSTLIAVTLAGLMICSIYTWRTSPTKPET